MALLKALIFRAARHLASDPAARQQAAELAKKAKPVVDKAAGEVRKVRQADEPAREMGRLAGRLKRKYLDGDDSSSGGGR